MAAKRQTKKQDAGQVGGQTGAVGKTRQAGSTGRKRAATEPPPHYGVLTEVEVDGEVWHYPVQIGSSVVSHARRDASPAAQVDGRAGPEFVYFNRVLPSGRLAQGAHAFMRFKRRIRAVRFIEDVVATHHETLSYLLGMGQGHVQGQGTSGQGAGGA